MLAAQLQQSNSVVVVVLPPVSPALSRDLRYTLPPPSSLRYTTASDCRIRYR